MHGPSLITALARSGGAPRLVPLLLPALLLAGCMQDPTYSISGSFAEDRTEADMQELEQLGLDHGGSVLFMESFPEQYVISGMEKDDCEDLRAILLDKAYLDTVGACAAEDDGTAYG